jgi:hypothetical protein
MKQQLFGYDKKIDKYLASNLVKGMPLGSHRNSNEWRR